MAVKTNYESGQIQIHLAFLGLLKNYVVKHGENHFRSILKIFQKFVLWIRIINWILIRNAELWIRIRILEAN
jgi:hypothetical protein